MPVVDVAIPVAFPDCLIDLPPSIPLPDLPVAIPGLPKEVPVPRGPINLPKLPQIPGLPHPPSQITIPKAVFTAS